MKGIAKVRLIMFLIVVSFTFLLFAAIFLHQTVTALLQSSQTLMFFTWEVSIYFIFDLSWVFIGISFAILFFIILFPVMGKIKLGGK